MDSKRVMKSVDEIKKSFCDFYDFMECGSSFEDEDTAKWFDTHNLAELVSGWVFDHVAPYIESARFSVSIIKIKPGTPASYGESVIKVTPESHKEEIMRHIHDAVIYACIPKLFTDMDSDKRMDGKGVITITDCLHPDNNAEINLSSDYEKLA